MKKLKTQLNELNLNVLLNNIDEIHILSDTLEYESHKWKFGDESENKDSLIVYEYTSNVRLIAEELILNNIPFSHYISEDVELSYLIIK